METTTSTDREVLIIRIFKLGNLARVHDMAEMSDILCPEVYDNQRAGGAGVRSEPVSSLAIWPVSAT
jgi:hypothetical protein